LIKQGIYTPEAGWAKFLGKLFIALCAMGVMLWFASGPENNWLNGSLTDRLLHLAWLVPAGVISYFATLGLLGFRLNDFKRRAAA